MQLALRAEQLGEAPSLFRLLRARQRLVDHTQPRGNLSGTAETCGKLSEKHSYVVMKAGIWGTLSTADWSSCEPGP